MEAIEALALAERGDVGALDRALATMGAHTDLERGWRACLVAARWSLDPGGQPPPRREEVQALVGAGAQARLAAARACAIMERASGCAFDREALASWLTVHKELLAGVDDESRQIELEIGQLWRSLFEGSPAGEDQAPKGVLERATRNGMGLAAVQVAALRALLALGRASVQESVDLARRAMRMAQAEGLPEGEYLAALALARCRRHTGRPHLALHILTALGRVAPPLWQAWIGWEATLAGRHGPDSAAETLGSLPPSLRQTVAGRALAALGRLLDAARASHTEEFQTQAAALEGATSGWSDLEKEVEALLACLDLDRPARSEELAAWASGEAREVPSGLHGIGTPIEPESEAAAAYVAAAPGRPGRRFLRPGLGLVRDAIHLEQLGPAGRGGARTDTGIATLALAGPEGIARDAFFQSVYGFRYVSNLHHGALDMLVHRMRARLGEAGEIEREYDTPPIRLRLHRAIVVPDVRCALPAADRVLRALATLGAVSAREAADALRMPLRTVQAALQQLVADGTCSVDRTRGRVAYKVNDTAFSAIITEAMRLSLGGEGL
jgi:hypothetical protein